VAIVIPIVAKFVDDGLKDAQKSIMETEKGYTKVAAKVHKLAGPSKAIVAGMGTALYTMAKNAGGAAKAQSKLEASMAAVGYKNLADEASDYAEKLQHVIGVSDEDIKSTMQKLSAYDATAESADMMARATLAAANMSAAGFGTMDSAAIALGRALQNPEKGIVALGKKGVQFTKDQEDQVKAMMKVGDTAGAQALIMEEVESSYDGVAKASASGTAKMKLAWDEASETMGSTLAPMITRVNELLIKLAGFVTENARAFRILAIAIMGIAGIIVVWDAINKVMVTMKAMNKVMHISKAAAAAYKAAMKLIGPAASAAGRGILAMTKALGLQKAALKAAAVATKVFKTAMRAMAGPIGWITAAIIALAIVIIRNWDKIKAVTLKVWGWVKGYLLKIWNSLKTAVSKTWNAITKVISKAWDLIKRILRLNPFIFVLTHLDWIKAKVGAAFDWVKTKIQNAWNAIKGLFKSNPFTAIKGFLDTMKGWFTSTFAEIGSKIEAFVGKVKGAAESVKGAFNKAKDLADKMPKPGKGKSGTSDSAAVYAMPVTRMLAGGVPAPTKAAPVRGGGGGGPVININGALDPEAVARQVRHLLDSHDRRQGRTVVRAVAF
jgi:phage-related protein